MKKPKCFQCNKSMKRPYERKGSQAVFTTINRWWYCFHCKKMELGPYTHSEDPSEYLHPEAAEKFPKISRIIQESPYIDINELKMNFETHKKRSAVLGEKWEKWIEMIDPRHHLFNQGVKTILKPKWKCNTCGILEDLSDQQISKMNGEDHLAQPAHCSKAMKITVIPEKDFLINDESDKRKEIMKLLQISREKNEKEKAGRYLLELFLSDIDIDHRIYDNYHAFDEFLKVARSNNDAEKNSWGYKTLLCLAQAFTKSGDIASFAINNNNNRLSKQFENVQLIDFKINEYTHEILQAVFDDIISYIRLKEPHLIPEYRLRFIKILLQIRHGHSMSHGINYRTFNMIGLLSKSGKKGKNIEEMKL